VEVSKDDKVKKATQLSQKDAISRKGMLSNITYDVTLALIKGKSYFGKTIIKFEYNGTQNVFIDYHGKKVNTLNINGIPINVDNSVFDGNRLYFDQKNLKNGSNEILIHFLNEYRSDGDGLHSFVDRADN